MFRNDSTDLVYKYDKFNRTSFLLLAMLEEIIDAFLCLTINRVDEV